MATSNENLVVFVTELLRASNKAAHIAQLCRAERTRFDLLVEEKTGEEKNKRFKQDFKTLADVLIQEVIRKDIGRKFPLLYDRVRGEENQEFTTSEGESIAVEVCATEQETCTLLGRVLGGHPTVAALLAKAVHDDGPEPILSGKLLSALRDVTVDVLQLGVWIDPIDGTNEYVQGDCPPSLSSGVHSRGLQCVTVLIGAYLVSSGEPVVGVVQQPFWRQEPSSGEWKGRVVWGVAHQGKTVSSLTHPLDALPPRHPLVVLSRSESQEVGVVKKAGWDVVWAAGVGYKLLCVCDGLVDAYLLTKNSSYKWDTCGPQAILRALGGNVLSLGKSLQSGSVQLHGCDVCYHQPDSLADQVWINNGGILAYRSPEAALGLISILAESNF